jgi:exosortase
MSELTISHSDPQHQQSPLEEERYYGLTPTAWVQVGTLALLFGITFLICLRRLWLKTNPYSGDPNWSHAICVPVIGLYYIYAHRRQVLKTVVATSWSALPIIPLGILMFGYGIWPGQNDFIKDVGMLTTLFGVAAFLGGWGMMKVLWFPIGFLACALPWPPLVYSAVALPLQELAAQVAVYVLQVSGVNAFFNGTKIFMEGFNGEIRTLNVAEACAGLRSLMTFITIGAAMAFLSGRPLWQKLLVTVSAVPIAIFCNVMRVSGQGLLDHYWSRQWSEGFAHQFAGMVMLIPAFFLLLLVGWLLDKVFVEIVPVADDGGQGVAEAAAKLEAQAAAAGTPLVVPPQRSHATVRRSKKRLDQQVAMAVAAQNAAGAENAKAEDKQ